MKKRDGNQAREEGTGCTVAAADGIVVAAAAAVVVVVVVDAGVMIARRWDSHSSLMHAAVRRIQADIGYSAVLVAFAFAAGHCNDHHMRRKR